MVIKIVQVFCELTGPLAESADGCTTLPVYAIDVNVEAAEVVDEYGVRLVSDQVHSVLETVLLVFVLSLTLLDGLLFKFFEHLFALLDLLLVGSKLVLQLELPGL